MELYEFSKLYDKISRTYDKLEKVLDEVIEMTMGVPLLNEKALRQAERLFSSMKKDLKRMEKALKEKEEEDRFMAESFRRIFSDAEVLVRCAEEEMGEITALLEQGI